MGDKITKKKSVQFLGTDVNIVYHEEIGYVITLTNLFDSTQNLIVFIK
jgi:hypothetical protein